MFTKIDATEYLDDLWGRDGPHMHIHITKFEEVLDDHRIVTIMSSYVCTFILHNIYMCTHYILLTMDGIIQARCRQRGHFAPLEIVLPPP